MELSDCAPGHWIASAGTLPKSMEDKEHPQKSGCALAVSHGHHHGACKKKCFADTCTRTASLAATHQLRWPMHSKSIVFVALHCNIQMNLKLDLFKPGKKFCQSRACH